MLVPRHQTCIDVLNWSLSVELFFTYPSTARSHTMKLKGSRLWITAFLLYCAAKPRLDHVSASFPKGATVQPVFHLSTLLLHLSGSLAIASLAERGSRILYLVSYECWLWPQRDFWLLFSIPLSLRRRSLRRSSRACLVCVIWPCQASTAISRLLSMSWLVILGE